MGLGWHTKALDRDNGDIVLFNVSTWKNALKREGWRVKSLDADNGRIFWHNGGTGGYRSYTGFAEGRDVGVVLLTNSTVPPDPTGLRLVNRLATLKAGQKSEERDGSARGSDG